MASTPITVADAVIALLNTHVFTPAITPVRSYRPIHNLEDLKTLQVDVVPRTAESTPFTRAQFSNVVEIDIAVQKKLTADDLADNDAADALMDLVQEIIDFLNGKDLTTLTDSKWVRTRNDPIYAPDHWEQFRQFTSLITVTYDLPIARA